MLKHMSIIAVTVWGFSMSYSAVINPNPPVPAKVFLAAALLGLGAADAYYLGDGLRKNINGFFKGLSMRRKCIRKWELLKG